MILIRGIKGDPYAQLIKKGIVSFGDLLSILLEPVKTGYALSDYEEYYVKVMFAKIFGVNTSPSPEEVMRYFDSQLVLNPIISNLYLTYFHILNSNSIDWLNNFENDTSFIYIIPKINKITNNVMTSHILGRKIEYVKAYDDYHFLDFEMSTLGILPMINNDLKISELNNFDSTMLYCERLFNIYKAIFTRVTDHKFSDIEQEFRVIYKFDNTIRSDGILYLNENREYPFIINNIPYKGYPFPKESNTIPDIYLEPPVPFNNTTYLNEFVKRSKIELKRSFIDVDIKPIAERYGYIGNKEQCKKFIEIINTQKTERQKMKLIKNLDVVLKQH